MCDAPVDAVEVKCTLSGDGPEPAIASFGLGEPDRRRTIWFFDALDPATGEPRLLRAGVILRLRRRKNGSGETTLKLRPARPELLVGDFRAGVDRFSGRYSVEYDWAHRPVLAASMDADVEDGVAAELVALVEPVPDGWSAEQLRLLREAGAPPPEPFAGLRAAGPIAAERWDDIGEGPLAGLRAERWTYGAGTRFLELSLQSPDLDDAAGRRDALLVELGRRGLQPDPAGTTKTAAVLRDLLGAAPRAVVGAGAAGSPRRSGSGTAA